MSKTILQPKKRSLWYQAFIVFRFTVPQLITFCFFLIPLIPLDFPFFKSVSSSLLLIPIFYWCVYRPNIIPSVLLFIYGVIWDVFSGNIIGITSLCFILIRVFLKSQRQLLVKQSFLTIWGSFVLISLVYNVVISIFTAILNGLSISISDIALSFLGISLLYPLVSPILIWAHKLVSISPKAS